MKSGHVRTRSAYMGDIASTICLDEGMISDLGRYSAIGLYGRYCKPPYA